MKDNINRENKGNMTMWILKVNRFLCTVYYTAKAITASTASVSLA